MAELADVLRDAGIADVAAGVPAAPHTTLRVGGPLDVLVTAESVEDLDAIGTIASDHDVPVLVLGRGSNLLVADSGFRGIAVRLGAPFRDVEIDPPTLVAGAAAALPTVARLAAEHGLAGLAWMAAVPGSIGGAVRMNAGAHGGETRDRLQTATVFSVGRGLRPWTNDELGFGYRHSAIGQGDIVVDATFELTPGQPEQLRADMLEIRQWRREHQPLNEPNCGSVFTNPPGDSAGRLIDAAGCKGLRIGGAMVSQRHANFIVTRPGAIAADVEQLIAAVTDAVVDTHGVELVTEVVRVGGKDG